MNSPSEFMAHLHTTRTSLCKFATSKQYNFFNYCELFEQSIHITSSYKSPY